MTKFEGNIGYGLKHSMYSYFQQAALDYYQLDVRYEALERSQENLEATVPVIRPQQNLRPNVTAPYKQASHLCWRKLVTWQVQSVLSTPQ